MGRLSLGFLVAAGVLLTAYFGVVAWRVSDDKDPDVTGQIPHHTYGWKPASAN